MANSSKKKSKSSKNVTRYTFDSVMEPRTPETGHTALLPDEDQVITLPMDNGWSKELVVGKLQSDERSIIVDIDPVADPLLLWSGKRSKKDIPVLPLQRNEIISESRIGQIVERANKALIDERSRSSQPHLFADLEKNLRESEKDKRVEFYTYDEGWKNKLICGDSLQVMESLLYYENMRGKVQMIFLDPPYGIDYSSNFQQRIDSTKNNEKDQADDILTIKAFRDTWALGIHSYLSYLQERLYLCREVLTDTGSIFVQISDDNVHLVRCLLDEVFGADNFIALIPFRKKTMPFGTTFIEQMSDFLLWYGKLKYTGNRIPNTRFRKLYLSQDVEGEFHYAWYEMPDGSRHKMTTEQNNDHSLLPPGARVYRLKSLEPSGEMASGMFDYTFEGRVYPHPKNGYATPPEGMDRLRDLRRLQPEGNRLTFILYADESTVTRLTAPWNDTVGADDKRYVVQTNSNVVARCLLMTTDPGDLVFDPTCGSGTTAYVAEKWGRRWITSDTSRVAINVARQRLLSSVFKHYRTRGNSVSSGFEYKKVRRVTLGSLVNNLEPEVVELVNDPTVDGDAIRVTGPFELMTLGRYSIEDWKGYVTESGKLENYISVICRLYRRTASIQSGTGMVHAIAESDGEKIAISVGPLSGRVAAKQINDAFQDALASGILEVHVLGWAFEANVGEVKSRLESRGKARVQLIMIRPDTLVEGLKATKPETLFSPLSLPDVEVDSIDGTYVVTLRGVGVFDRKRKSTDYYAAGSGYVAAWYLDEDYDGDCFVDCQMFFDFKKKPNINAALKGEVDVSEYKLQLSSHPFTAGKYERMAVKVVDIYGNESTLVKELAKS